MILPSGIEVPTPTDWRGINEGEINFAQAMEAMLPAQMEGVTARERYAALSGGFGSGKTVWLGVDAILNGMAQPNGFSLIGRLHKPELKITTQKTFLELFPYEWMKSWVPSGDPPTLTGINNHEYIFLHLDMADPAAQSHIRSANLSGFYIDQGEEVTELAFLTLVGRLRRKGISHYQGRVAANPNGSDWIWQKFFDAKRSPRMKGLFKGIIADTRDNIHLREGYVDEMLSIYPDDWKERFVYGSFADFSGKVYKDWNINVHGWDCTEEHACFCDADGRPQGHPPEHWPVIVGIDIGGGVDPWSFVFIAVQPETGNLFQFAEIHEQGILIRTLADQYFQHMERRNLEGAAYDWENEAAAIELAGEGIAAARANKDVSAGTFKVAQYLHPDPRIASPFTDIMPAPRYYVCKNCCPFTCRSLANLSWKKDRSGNDTNEIKHDEHSHDAAAVRYAIHTFRPEPVKMKKPQQWENPALDPLSRQYWREIAAMEKRGYHDPHERYPKDARKSRTRFARPFAFRKH